MRSHNKLMSDRPLYIEQNLNWVAALSTQTATRNLSVDNTILLGTTGVKGALFDSVELKRTGNVATDAVLFIFIRKSGATTKFIYKELLIPAVTASTTEAIASLPLELPLLNSPVGAKGLRFEAGLEVWVGLSAAIANSANIFFTGGNLN